MMPPLPTGLAFLDERLGGFHVGDNVIVEAEVGAPPNAFVRAFMAAALGRGERVVYASFDRSPATLAESLAALPRGDLVVLDAFTEGKGRGEDVFRAFYERARPESPRVVKVDYPARPLAFHEDFDAAMAPGRGTFCVVDSLTGMQELWRSEERVRAFYTHTCPRLFDTRAIAVWVLVPGVHSPGFRASIGHVGQVLLRLEAEGPTLRIVRALGRPSAAGAVAYEETAEGIRPAKARRKPPAGRS